MVNQGAQATLEPFVSDVSTGYETRASYWALFLLTSAPLAIPLWTVRILPLVDFSAHLARCYIIAHSSAFSAFYQVHWGVIPNLAIDVVLPPLLRVIRPLLAAKIFLTLTVILYAFSVHFLARSIYGRSTWVVILALGLFYNNCLLYGFVNYAWGVSFFLLTLGCWLRYRNAPQSRWWALAFTASIITFFCST